MNYQPTNAVMQKQAVEQAQYATVRLGADCPAPISPIHARTNTLEQELSVLQEVITILANKIAPVLIPDYPLPCDPASKEPERNEAPMVNMLNEAIKQLVNQRLRISGLIDRIAL